MLPFVQPKDLVYICAPAKAIDEKSVRFAKTFFEQNHFQVELSQHVLGQNNYFSGTEKERLADLQAGLNHPEAKVILCARGGYGCIQLLEQLDWTEFQKNPKWIVGFSDITVLHLALSQMKISSLHATMPLNFEKNSPDSLTSFLRAIGKKEVKITAVSSEFNINGEATGILVGGNLAIVHAMLPYLEKNFFKDKILFLEDVGEHLYQIDRMLYGLKFAGAFDNIAGLMLGGFTNISDTDAPFGKTLEEIFAKHLAHKNIPVGFHFPCGHLNDNQALILGSPATLAVDLRQSTLSQSH
ncbi:MAG: LD-carboxypeptidase [Crocinitomicaceae bacterium]